MEFAYGEWIYNRCALRNTDTQEMFTRSFACYISDKCAEKGIVCDYLNGHADSAVTIYEDKAIIASPVGEERKAINKAFDKLVESSKERGLLHTRAPERTVQKVEAKTTYGQLKFDGFDR